VLLNLVGNAIKFTDAGEVRVSASSANGHFAVSVTDTGPGIPEEHQARIFEQFHQVDSSNTKAKGGTGIGLAIAKQIVETIRRGFNMIAVWSSDRLGRSLRHLIEVLEIIRDTGTGLYIHTQSVDTTTPAGRAMFGMLGIFSEFEREMIVARVNAGLARARDAIARDGHFTSKAGKVRKRLGRPNADPKKLEAARRELARGTGVLKTAKLVGLGTGTVQRLKHAVAQS
jgi:DNA invertase Pin-like site-specific DNA recombinase